MYFCYERQYSFLHHTMDMTKPPLKTSLSIYDVTFLRIMKYQQRDKLSAYIMLKFCNLMNHQHIISSIII